MPRSLANGDYSLLMAVESSSRSDSWYRVLVDRQSGRLSCDCPPYIFKQDAQATDDERSCHHTRFGMQLASLPTPPAPSQSRTAMLPTGIDPAALIAATQRQWPGLRGRWSVEGQRAQINGKPYLLLLLRLEPGNGGLATGVIAFAERHHPGEQHIQSRVAGWCGYAIAAEVARLGGYPMAGQPPEHFRVSSSRRRAGRAAPDMAGAGVAIGLSDILRVGDQVDLGDGLQPVQRAENTLRLFLGESLYRQLETQHFLDVSSVRYAGRRRVYRLRRDPQKRRERRVRVFEQGAYIKDFCIVRAQNVPEADHFLTVFLSLLSDEEAAISVVQHYNIFGPFSDGVEQETVPAFWQPRAAA